MEMVNQTGIESRVRYPIGYSDFSEIIRHKLDFVDKTLFIKEVFDNVNTQVTVITRPRRFGKTLNLSMLRYFLAPEVYGQSTQGLFKGLKIAQLGDQYMQYQGQYPVIFVTFKDMKGSDYPTVYASLCNLIFQLYDEHRYLLSSAALAEDEKRLFLNILEKKADPDGISYSLRNLSSYLYKHTGIRPWILIDEYDTPIQSGYLNDYYEPMVGIIRTMFGVALKDNPFLERSMITGILRISKESLFSGVNNIKVCSILDNRYSEHFGFTELEVEQILRKTNLFDHYASIRNWYNGYQIGRSVIYNPWSLINCVQEGGLLKPYWVNTSGNDLVKHVLARGSRLVKMNLELIIHHESITALINENMVFGDLAKDSSSMWSLLLFCGYLKVIHMEYKNTKIQCELAVPNQEIMALYREVIYGWLGEPMGEQYLEFLLSLTEGRVEEFTDYLQKYLLETISIFDITGHEPEKFYHGFVLGMMVSLADTHEVKSNHKSGYGRYDVMLIPKDIEQLGIVIEFKTVRSNDPMDLTEAAQEALQQIEQRAYAVELKQRGIQHILKMGLAFRNKQVAHEFSRE